MTFVCIEKMKQYFRINENGESKYTVGQVKSILVKEGYPVGLVNSCLTKMLEDQHICY